MTEKIADIEQRCTPRFRVDIPIETDALRGRLIDMSDRGLRVSLTHELREKVFNLNLPLVSSRVQCRATVKWSAPENRDAHHVYGVQIDGIHDAARADIRKYFILRSFESIAKAASPRARRSVLRFANELLSYISGIDAIVNELYKLSIVSDMTESNILKTLSELNNNIVRKGDALKKDLDDKILITKIKKEFRCLVSYWAFQSQIVKRCFEKPKGYPGDYRSLEVIYDRETFSDNSNIGYYYDKYFLDNPYAIAVRNRKEFLKNVLITFINDRRGVGKILNLASGSCREIRELIDVWDNKNQILFSCLDWDEDAHSYSKLKLRDLSCGVRTHFIREDVLRFAKSATFFETNGSYDLCYSVGLADYLPDRIIKKIIQTVYTGLNPGGEFILAFKDKEYRFSHLPPEWFCDWIFVARNEHDVIQLYSELNLVPNTIKRDPTGQVFFVTLIKPK